MNQNSLAGNQLGRRFEFADPTNFQVNAVDNIAY